MRNKGIHFPQVELLFCYHNRDTLFHAKLLRGWTWQVPLRYLTVLLWQPSTVSYWKRGIERFLPQFPIGNGVLKDFYHFSPWQCSSKLGIAHLAWRNGSTKEHSNYLPLVHLSPQSFSHTKNRIPMAGAKLQNQRESNSKARAERVYSLCRAQNYFDGTSNKISKFTRYAR